MHVVVVEERERGSEAEAKEVKKREEEKHRELEGFC